MTDILTVAKQRNYVSYSEQFRSAFPFLRASAAKPDAAWKELFVRFDRPE
jgi:hypothetical protein